MSLLLVVVEGGRGLGGGSLLHFSILFLLLNTTDIQHIITPGEGGRKRDEHPAIGYIHSVLPLDPLIQYGVK